VDIARLTRTRWARLLTGWIAVAVVWGGLLLLVALPAWRQAVVRHKEIATLEKDLARLNSWTIAGLWLKRSQDQVGPAINEDWERTFPAGRYREELFLDLAQVADGSGVENFNLEELDASDMLTRQAIAQDEVYPEDSYQGDVAATPQVSLDSYRVKASFTGNYREAARFMGGLQAIDRALSVHDLVVRPSGEWIQVDLELDVYVSQSS